MWKRSAPTRSRPRPPRQSPAIAISASTGRLSHSPTRRRQAARLAALRLRSIGAAAAAADGAAGGKRGIGGSPEILDATRDVEEKTQPNERHQGRQQAVFGQILSFFIIPQLNRRAKQGSLTSNSSSLPVLGLQDYADL